MIDLGIITFDTEPSPGGFVPLNLNLSCNTNGDKTRENVRHALTLDLTVIRPKEASPYTAVLVGGGPSLQDDIEQIRLLQVNGFHIFALNGSAKFLNEHSIVPDYQVIIDPRPENVSLLGEAFGYLIASQCDPALFDKVKDKNTALFHLAGSAYDMVDDTVIGGNVTVGLTTMCLAFTMGYRSLHLYGYDSSFEDNQHAYPQDRTDQEQVLLDVKAKDKFGEDQHFKTNYPMAKQADLFPGMVQMLTAESCKIFVHGKGLLPTIAHAMMKG